MAAKELLLDPVEYQDFPGQSPEFDALLTKFFGLLPKSDQEIILGIVEAGLNLEPFKSHRGSQGNPATDQELSELADQWRVRWLRQIKDALPDQWRERYAGLVNRLGEPPLHDPPFKTGGSFVGPTSPKGSRRAGIGCDERARGVRNNCVSYSPRN